MAANAGAKRTPLQIWKGTRLSTLLLVHPQMIEILVAFDPSLAPLREEQPRRMLAHRLSLSDVARRSGKPVDDLIAALEREEQRTSN